MKKQILFLLCFTFSLPVTAQKMPVRSVRQAVASPTLIGIGQAQSMHSSGLHALAGALELQYMQAAAQNNVSAVKAAQSSGTVQHRSWLEQQQRNFQAWKLKRQRRIRDRKHAQQEQTRQLHQTLLASLPQANPEHAFETGDLTPFLAENLPAEEIPLLPQEGVLFRGMALDPAGTSLHAILTHGIRLQDLGSHASTKLLAMSGGMRGTVSAVSSHPAINLTSFLQDALYWGTQRIEPGKELLVIVKVEGMEQSGKVVLYSQDIPASYITQVVVPLSVNGKAAWCEIKQTENNKFLVTPYDILPYKEGETN